MKERCIISLRCNGFDRGKISFTHNIDKDVTLILKPEPYKVELAYGKYLEAPFLQFSELKQFMHYDTLSRSTSLLS